MNAEIITIGDEILIGQIVDTNSAWIAEQLNRIGIRIVQITSISDSEGAIYKTIDQSLSKSDVVILTGGLGPTSDDITKTTLCKYFGDKLILHEPSLSLIKEFFRKRGSPLTESNRKQAEVPSSCTVLLNYYGTAPGMLFRYKNKILTSLPGVPFEMKEIMNDSVIPLLREINQNQVIIHRVVNTFGIPESHLSDKLQGFERKIPKHIGLAYLPSPSGIKLRLSGYSDSRERLNGEINMLIDILKSNIPEYIFGYGNTSLSEVVGQMLGTIGSTVSTAESCTGGMVSHLITEIPGSSDYYKGSVVAYANTVKTALLDVDVQALTVNGAVSQQVAEQMAVGVQKLIGTDYSLAISGIAGPTGGTEQKPVGLAWIAVSSKSNLLSRKFVYGNQRDINILRASNSALNMLRELILAENPSLKENIFGEKFD